MPKKLGLRGVTKCLQFFLHSLKVAKKVHASSKGVFVVTPARASRAFAAIPAGSCICNSAFPSFFALLWCFVTGPIKVGQVCLAPTAIVAVPLSNTIYTQIKRLFQQRFTTIAGEVKIREVGVANVARVSTPHVAVANAAAMVAMRERARECVSERACENTSLRLGRVK